MSVAVAYAQERAVGRLERLAQERAARDHARWTATAQEECEPGGYWYDAEEAERPIIFAEEYCRHYKGKQFAGKPLTLGEWQRFQYREVFGWRDENGNRRFTTWWQEVARKNGKSTGGGALGLYMLISDGEPGAEVYSAATKVDQARIIFTAAKEICKRSPALRKHVDVMTHNLNVPETASKFEALSSDHHTLDGLNPNCALVDEIHAHKDRGLWDVLVSALGAREQPLTAVFTTAGIYDPEQIGWELHDYAVKILEQVLDDDTFFVFIAAADEDDDWQSEAFIEKANPNIDVSVSRKYLHGQRKAATHQPNKRGPFMRYHGNRWTATRDSWFKPEDWHACDKLPARSLWTMRRTECFGGLDLSTKLDLTSFALAFERADLQETDKRNRTFWEVYLRHYMPEERVALASVEDHAPYQRWVEEGWITTTPGDVIDYDFIERDIVQCAAVFNLKEVAYDPYNATGLANTLLQTHGINAVSMRQGYATMSEPSKDYEALVVSHRLVTRNNPVLRWEANNAMSVQDAAGNIKPDKVASRKRIDGVVASIMAVGRALQAAAQGGSIYSSRGLTTIGGPEEES